MQNWSRGWESHPPEGVYEAPLCALVEFPAVKSGGGRRVTLPLTPVCRTGASLFCHAPEMKLASRPGAAPGKLSFGNSAARWCATYAENKKRGAHIGAPRLAIATKNKHRHSRALACRGLWPQVFHGGPFGVWGTPSAKPLDCKVWDFSFGACYRANLSIPISKSVVVAFRYCY